MVDFIAFKLAESFRTFATMEDFELYCSGKGCKDSEGTVRFEDGSYIRFHGDEFTLGAPPKIEWF